MKALLLLIVAASFATGAQGNEPVTLLFAGDVTLSDNVERFVGTRFDYVFHHWKPGSEADVFMVNLEHPITRSEARVEKKFNFKMNPSLGRILIDGGVTIVNSANNHIFDYGFAGIDDTMRYLDSLGIRYTGIGRNLREARRPVILERRGRRIGFLGYYGSGDFAATDSQAGFAPRSTRLIVNDVQSLRLNADFIVVNFHWGAEREPFPEDWQVALAHRVVDAGADLIIGHHPHVLQGIERYKGATIAYSLGNFVFGGNSLHTYETAVLKVTLDGADRRVELIPVSVREWQPRPSSGTTRDEVLSLVRDRSARFGGNLFFTGAEE